ncbi:MAG: citrate synthase, partial [Clostridia bacterium]|nr:citrate synthase [Clostridia bacterium]
MLNDDKFNKLLENANGTNYIDPQYYQIYNVKRGLRNPNGTGVLVGLTNIGDVHGYIFDENEKVDVEGRLSYRGVNVTDLVNACIDENRFGFEETIFLILFGKLPTKSQLDDFKAIINNAMNLPANFTEDMILKIPSPDIMNKLGRCVLVLYSNDDNPDDLSFGNLIKQSIQLISRFPVMIAHAYCAKIHYYNGKSLYIHSPQKNLSIAENFLYMIRPDNKFTDLEAKVLDLCLILHAEHGAGNNSTFVTKVVSSTGTDTYSAISASVGSLKGPKHGGANNRVIGMMEEIKENVKDWSNDEELSNYLRKILKKQAYDKSGLVYGMGHAVYTISDPRAVLLKKYAQK